MSCHRRPGSQVANSNWSEKGNKRRNMAPPDANTTVIEVPEPKLEHTVSEKTGLSIDKAEKLGDGAPNSPEIEAAPPVYDADSNQEKDDEKDDESEGAIIITGTDAAKHLLPMRDDGEPSLSFRSIFLATGLSAFQAVMYQIYMVRSHQYFQDGWLLQTLIQLRPRGD